MRIDTKFDLGETVIAIRSQRAETWIPCAFCGAEGRVAGANGQSRHCPDCFGRKGRKDWLPQAWRTVGAMTVGQVRVIMAQDGRVEEYMLVETGVGSGSVWKAADLFATADVAEAACNARNAIETPVPA